jgi:microcystin degradation protein MlrC
LTRRPRIFAGGLATETNSFSPLPTGYDDFRRAPPGAPQDDRDTIFFGRSFRSYAAVATRRGLDLEVGSFAFAIPAGPPPRAAYERLRDELLAEIRGNLPLDGVLLTLHGAMVCEGVPDCETDIVQRVRETVGDAPIGVLLDLHCDVPPELIDAADAVVVVREYPHVDVEPRATQLAEIIADATAGITQPTMARFDCRVVALVPTVREPMRGFVDQVLVAAEDEPGVLAASLGHGFPYLDAPGVGACAVVVSNADVQQAEEVAARVGSAFYAIRHEVALSPIALDRALDHALSQSHDGPLVLADTADNAGGGAPSDSTFVLAELLRRGVRDAGVAPLWDPGAVRVAFAAELGSTVDLRLGGKSTRFSGDPLDVTARVKGHRRNLVQRWPQADGFAEMPLGDAACLDVDGIDVVVVSLRDQAFGLELFTSFGIDPAAKRLLVLKSANHFRAAYDPIASDVVYVDAGGALPADPRDIPYTRFGRQAFPWIDDPLADGAVEPLPSQTSRR